MLQPGEPASPFLVEATAAEEAEEEMRLAAAACSGVPYFLGLPLFLLTLSGGEEIADEGTE